MGKNGIHGLDILHVEDTGSVVSKSTYILHNLLRHTHYIPPGKSTHSHGRVSPSLLFVTCDQVHPPGRLHEMRGMHYPAGPRSTELVSLPLLCSAGIQGWPEWYWIQLGWWGLRTSREETAHFNNHQRNQWYQRVSPDWSMLHGWLTTQNYKSSTKWTVCSWKYLISCKCSSFPDILSPETKKKN